MVGSRPVVQVRGWGCADFEIGIAQVRAFVRPVFGTGTHVMSAVVSQHGRERKAFVGDFGREAAYVFRVAPAAVHYVVGSEYVCADVCRIDIAFRVVPTVSLHPAFGHHAGIAVGENGVDGVALVERVECLIARSRQVLDFLHLILVVGEAERSVDAQSVIHGAKDFAVELELHAGVHGLAVVDGERRLAGGRVEVGDSEQVGAELVIPVDGAAQAVAEE